MRNPWLDIPLRDYETHMSLPSIGQSMMLGDQFEQLMARKSPASVAIIGCAGGNGLERIIPGRVRRVVAVDLNPEYVKETGNRFASMLQSLELHCADVQSSALRFDPVDFIYAALIFEYVEIVPALATLRHNCRPGGTLAVVLQLPYPGHDAVSPSPFKTLSVLAPVIRHIEPTMLCAAAAVAGFTAEDSRTIEVASGKRFWLQTFQATEISPVIGE